MFSNSLTSHAICSFSILNFFGEYTTYAVVELPCVAPLFRLEYQHSWQLPSRLGSLAPAGGAVFGDSLTEGYFNIWRHPIFGPNNPDDPAQEMTRLRLHPYSIQLGARLAADAADDAAGYTPLHYGVVPRVVH